MPEREEVSDPMDDEDIHLAEACARARCCTPTPQEVLSLIARIERDAATVEQLTKELVEARAEVVSFQRKYTIAMAEVARLRADAESWQQRALKMGVSE